MADTSATSSGMNGLNSSHNTQIPADHPYYHLLTPLTLEDGVTVKHYFNIGKLNDPRVKRLPYCIRVLLEGAVRQCDNFLITQKDVETILDWEKTCTEGFDVAFKPSRVLLQDFTGVPAVVDLATMRQALVDLGCDAKGINPLVPVDLVIDHSVQVDKAGSFDAIEINESLEFERNKERFAFLKWGATAFDNMLIVPPGVGIVHQINLEYLARVVFDKNGILYPDSVVGTDSHTTMIDGLGVVGWGVGGIEAEAVMLGNPISMVLPEVVGFRLDGELSPGTTSTDLVLTVTRMLRKRVVVGKFVEFYGPGCAQLSLADRATIGNMSPEYGATMGYFPADHATLSYLRQTGRSAEKLDLIEKYLRANHLFRDYSEPEHISFTGEVMHLDLTTVVPSLAGPKRPHDHVALADMQKDFQSCLVSPVGFKGYGLKDDDIKKSISFTFEGVSYTLRQGSVVIASITSCTNTSNPSVMLGAGLLAKKAVEKGLKILPYVKSSLSPGSAVVSRYLSDAGLMSYLQDLGFYKAGYGCMTCIGNSGDLSPEITAAITESDLVVSAVLSGNRNFEGRVHPLTRANYLASPPLCVAYALAGTVDINFETDPIGIGYDGQGVYLRDIFPTQSELAEYENKYVTSRLFHECYANVQGGNERWNSLKVTGGDLFDWDDNSTYIHKPPFFEGMTLTPPPLRSVKDAYCLLNLGDSITTDHISPAGKIARNSPAAEYLISRGVAVKDFNTYGSRRGNDEVMARGTFANIRLINKMVPKPGPYSLHIPSGTQMAVFTAAEEYMKAGYSTIILAGNEYGSGSSRDWAAKGPFLQGVRAVIAQSYERIHRSNLVGMGIIPLQFLPGESAATLNLTGHEQFSFELKEVYVGQVFEIKVSNGTVFQAKSRLDTEVELAYYKHGGILQYVLRSIASN